MDREQSLFSIVLFITITFCTADADWISHRGCYSDFKYDKRKMIQFSLLLNQPGRCSQLCKNFAYFGLNHKTCYCFDKDVYDTLYPDKNCFIQCPGFHKIYCGSYNGQVSVYERHTDLRYDGPGYCLAMSFVHARWKYENAKCDSVLNVRCKGSTYQGKHSFFEAKLTCENAGGRLYTFNETHPVKDNHKYWVATFRSFVKDSSRKMITINKDPTGQEGSNGTSIQCIINMDGIGIVRKVSIYAFINTTMTVIITYYNHGETVISPAGEYLRDRVTYNTITGQSNRATLRFNTLICEDDTDYQCQLLYVPDLPGPSKKAVSELSHLSVNGLPSRPEYMRLMTVNNIQQNRNIELETRNLVFVEGDKISLTCYGEVGKPPRHLLMHKILRNGMAYNLMRGDSPMNKVSPNCSSYQNNSFITTLTEEDHWSVLRCAVEGFINDENMSIQTGQIVILYPVQIPDIHVYPNQSTKPPVTLHCIGKGNPDPHFAWFKLSNISQTNSFEFYASTPVITLNRTSDSGVYRCDVYNKIGINEYRNSSIVTVTFEVTAVIGGAFGLLAICIVSLAIVFISKNKSKRNSETEQPGASIPDQNVSLHYEEIGGEQTGIRHTEAATRLSLNYEGMSSERTNHEYTELL